MVKTKVLSEFEKVSFYSIPTRTKNWTQEVTNHEDKLVLKKYLKLIETINSQLSKKSNFSLFERFYPGKENFYLQVFKIFYDKFCYDVGNIILETCLLDEFQDFVSKIVFTEFWDEDFWINFAEEYFTEENFWNSQKGIKKNFLYNLLSIEERMGNQSSNFKKISGMSPSPWIAIAINEFLNTTSKMEFGEWLDDSNNLDLIDENLKNFEFKKYQTSSLVEQSFWREYSKIGKLFSANNQQLWNCFSRLDQDNLNKVLFSVMGNGKSQKYIIQKIEDLLNFEEEKNASLSISGLQSLVDYLGKTELDIYSIYYLKEILDLLEKIDRTLKIEKISSYSKIVEEISELIHQISLKDFWLFLECLLSPDLWLKGGKDFSWILVRKFAEKKNFTDFAQAIVDFSLNSESPTLSVSEWEKVLEAEGNGLSSSLLLAIFSEKHEILIKEIQAKNNLKIKIQTIENLVSFLEKI